MTTTGEEPADAFSELFPSMPTIDDSCAFAFDFDVFILYVEFVSMCCCVCFACVVLRVIPLHIGLINRTLVQGRSNEWNS